MDRETEFRDTLAIAIGKSGLTLRELADRCDAEGVHATYSYLSKVRSGTLPPPSDKVARALARILGIDPAGFVLQAQIGRAPKELRTFLAEMERTNRSLNGQVTQLAINNNCLESELGDVQSLRDAARQLNTQLLNGPFAKLGQALRGEAS